MSEGDIITQCLENVGSLSSEKATRQFLLCITQKLSDKNIKRIVVDNGTKYNMMIYLEVHDKELYKNIIDKIVNVLDKILESRNEISKLVQNYKVINWVNESYVILSKEYVVVKYVLE